MNTNPFLDPDDRPFVNIRVHSWLNFLSNRFLNIEVENAVSHGAFAHRPSQFKQGDVRVVTDDAQK